MKDCERDDFLYFETRTNELKILNEISFKILDELKDKIIDFDRVETLSYIYKNIKG